MTSPTVQQKASFWLGLVFLLGIALGAVAGYAFAHRGYAAERTLTAEQRRAQKRREIPPPGESLRGTTSKTEVVP